MRDAAIDTHRSPARGSGRARAAGAPPLDDMVGEGPVSRGAPRRGGITSAAVAAQRLGGGRSPDAAARGRRGPGLAARFYGRLPRIRPLKALTVAAFGVALVGIVANAMVFQRGHHPSPLFGLGRSVDGTSDAAERTAAAVPAPAVPAPVENTGTILPTVAAPVDPAPPAAAAPPKPAPVHHAAAKVHREEASASKPAGPTAAHPRPGRPAQAKAEAKPDAKPEPKVDPVARLLAGPAHPAKPDVKAAPAAKPDAKAAPVAGATPAAKVAPAVKAHGVSDAKAEPKPAAAGEAARPAKVAAAAPHPHHRLAATAPAEGAKPAAEAE